MKKNKSLVGHMVKVRKQKLYDDPFSSDRGEVVAEVRQGKQTHYIVSFPHSRGDDWSWFTRKQLKLDK